MKNPESLIPQQCTGVENETHHHVTADSEAAAEHMFNRAKARLLQVNEWAVTAEGMSAKFLLCDSVGSALSRPAQQGDFVRIDLPGPGRASNTGYDWVVLDPVEVGIDEAGNPWLVVITRPTADPMSNKPDEPDTAHFFSDASAGIFVIRHCGLRVEGSHYGRNEQPNTDGSFMDKARDLVVAVGAYLGLSQTQWSNLVKGLLA